MLNHLAPGSRTAATSTGSGHARRPAPPGASALGDDGADPLLPTTTAASPSDRTPVGDRHERALEAAHDASSHDVGQQLLLREMLAHYRLWRRTRPPTRPPSLPTLPVAQEPTHH